MNLNNIKKEAEQIRMSAAEKAAMRQAIFPTLQSGPRPQSVGVGSPYFVFSAQFLHTRMLVPLAVLLVISVSGGTAFAAQGAAPGDLLYPVKISVNEQVQTALASNPVAKAQVHTELAQRRVEEAEALAVKGQLDVTTTAALAANFEEHASSAQAIATAVAAEDPGTGTELQADIDSTLAAHGAILAALGEDSTNVATQEGSSDLSDKVLARATFSTRAASTANAKVAVLAVTTDADADSDTKVGNQTLSVSVAAKISATTSTSSAPQPVQVHGQKVSAQLEAKAASTLGDAHDLFKQVQDKLDATTTAQVQEQFADIDALMSGGSEALSANDTTTATASFTRALTLSITLSTILEAQQKLDKNITSPLLQLGN